MANTGSDIINNISSKGGKNKSGGIKNFFKTKKADYDAKVWSKLDDTSKAKYLKD
jgi:hypothetical protein